MFDGKTMLREKIREEISAFLKECFLEGGPGGFDFSLDSPPPRVSGDLAANVALVAGKRLGKPPQALAQELSERFPKNDWCEKIDVAGPGFLNFSIRGSALVQELEEILKGGPGYSAAPPESKSSVLIEFVSANPTGPLHVGHGRGAALGDCLARIFKYMGYAVTTEYYLNDIGNQIEVLGRSVAARRDELDGKPTVFPENGYRGEYVVGIARRAKDNNIPDNQLAGFAVQEIMSSIQIDLTDFRVHFDRWFRESSLYEKGLVDQCFETLRKKGTLYESEGALWFASSRFSDDKDRVLKRRDERPTYFASDIAYHLEKFTRGYDQLINIWGADHHGYAPRLKSALTALDEKPERLTILLYQLVSLLRDGQPIAMSTRSGQFDTLHQLIDEVGADACRFFYAIRAPETHLEFDLELAKKQAPENPVYYVQYVHARICSIFREARQTGVSIDHLSLSQKEVSLEKEERQMILELSRFLEVVRLCARDLTPHHLTTYLFEIAQAFHSFYESHRVLSQDPDVTRWRLSLLEGVRRVVKQGLELLGVSAPEKL